MTSFNLHDYKDKYLYLFSDCFLTKGHTRTMICDITRKQIYFVNNPYYDVLLDLRQKSIGEIMDTLETESDIREFNKFINYLLKKELGIIVDDIRRFPPIDQEWDSPHAITNAIIDLRNKKFDFEKIFRELEELNCPHIQIRCYTELSPGSLSEILACARGLHFRSIQVLVKYDPSVPMEEYQNILKNNQLAFITFHSVGEDQFEQLNLQYENSEFSFLHQAITSCANCGVINTASFYLNDIQDYVEHIKFNSCLNRKISVDEDGYIRNCPSMKDSYGHIEDTSLTSVAQLSGFSKFWNINKDSISICRDCEFRYICTDCRAYLVDEKDLCSKPLKCGYDPYTGEWER